MRKLLSFCVLAFVAGRGAFHLLDCLFPFPDAGLERFGRSPRVVAADGTPMRVGLTPRSERLVYVGLHEMSPHLVRAALAQEDRRFMRHGGVDGRALLRALLSRTRQGGSTISMQLARLADPLPRTVPGKAAQAFRALQLEARRDKRFILERYLNLVPFSGNLRGVGAAAHAWFGKRAADLTAPEAALLISVLPSPTRYDPRRNPKAALKRRNRLLGAMGLDSSAPLGLKPTRFPDLAPHAWLRAGDGATTIDPAAQKAVETIAARAGGVDGLAIVVVENPTRAIRALVGARRPHPGVLDATGRPRSAGSTLKPLLYALAFDLGLAAPQTRLLDLPWSSRDWAPKNFDRTARGPVTAAEALRESYNLPAVRLAAALPRGAFAATLRRAGLRHVRTLGPAIDLAIGTDDTTPLELAGAYAALANGGVYEAPWLVRRSAKRTRVCSAQAAAMVTSALARQGVASKTGTSSRRRDAWAAGYTRRFTAVVWRGRLDGRPHDSLVGARAARPLLLDVLGAIDPDPAPTDHQLPTTNICRASGLRATPDCPATTGAALENLRTCGIHVRLPVANGLLRCARCGGGTKRPFALYPPAWAAWRHKSGLPLDRLPPHDPDCPDPMEPRATSPVILSPRDGQRLDGGELVVRALALDPEAELTVLLDGRVVGKGTTLALRVEPGRHTLAVVSPRGRTATAGFTSGARPCRRAP